jgi:hypothetical protein
VGFRSRTSRLWPLDGSVPGVWVRSRRPRGRGGKEALPLRPPPRAGPIRGTMFRTARRRRSRSRTSPYGSIRRPCGQFAGRVPPRTRLDRAGCAPASPTSCTPWSARLLRASGEQSAAWQHRTPPGGASTTTPWPPRRAQRVYRASARRRGGPDVTASATPASDAARPWRRLGTGRRLYAADDGTIGTTGKTKH